MKQIPNKEYEKYQQYQTDRCHGDGSLDNLSTALPAF